MVDLAFSEKVEEMKRRDDKKVPFSFQVPLELKKSFQNLCRENDITFSDGLRVLMEIAVSEFEKIRPD